MATIPSKEHLANLYQILSDSAIAESFSVSPATVLRWRRHYGILSKPRGPRAISGQLSFRDISDEAIKAAIPMCFSVMEVCRKVGLCETGQGHTKMKVKISHLGVDTSHFGTQHPRTLGLKGYQQSLQSLLVEGSIAQSNKLKQRLLKEGILAEECSQCYCLPVWLGKPLTLQLDHISGDSTDNRLGNLRLLCPNCHSQTVNYAGRNKSRSDKAHP